MAQAGYKEEQAQDGPAITSRFETGTPVSIEEIEARENASDVIWCCIVNVAF